MFLTKKMVDIYIYTKFDLRRESDIITFEDSRDESSSPWASEGVRISYRETRVIVDHTTTKGGK